MFKQTICAIAIALTVAGCGAKVPATLEEVKEETVILPYANGTRHLRFEHTQDGFLPRIRVEDNLNPLGAINCFYTPGNANLCYGVALPKQITQAQFDSFAKALEQNAEVGYNVDVIVRSE